MTYKTLDPGPYWPETGHAQITFRPSSAGIVALPADAREADKMLRCETATSPSDSAHESAGISPPSAEGLGLIALQHASINRYAAAEQTTGFSGMQATVKLPQRLTQNQESLMQGGRW